MDVCSVTLGKDVLYQRVLELDDSLLAWLMKSNAYAFVIEILRTLLLPMPNIFNAEIVGSALYFLEVVIT